MSKSIMYDLYYGNLVPSERGCPPDPNYSLINRKIIALKEHFASILSPEEYKRFDEVEDLHSQSDTIEAEHLFEYAFCMGALMMINIFDFKERRITEP